MKPSAICNSGGWCRVSRHKAELHEHKVRVHNEEDEETGQSVVTNGAHLASIRQPDANQRPNSHQESCYQEQNREATNIGWRKECARSRKHPAGSIDDNDSTDE